MTVPAAPAGARPDEGSAEPAEPRRPTSRVGRARLLPRLLAAVATGLLLALAFPPYGVWVSALPAVAGFTLLLRGRTMPQAAMLGLVHGLAFFLPLLDWMRVIGDDAWAGLALLEAAFVVMLALGLALVSRLAWWPLWSSGLWVAAELARSRLPFGGFPWGRVAFSQTASPFTGWAAIGGSPLVTFATVGCALLLGVAVREARQASRRALVALAAALLVPLGGLLVPRPAAGHDVTVAIVQGDVPRSGLDFLGQRAAVLHNHVQATLALAADVAAGRAPQPDLVVWPENSSDLDPYQDADARALISSAVDAIGVPVLVGAVIAGPDSSHDENVGIVWAPGTGPGAVYVKRHPVPFGEYVPFRSVLQRYITRLDRIPKDYAAGRLPGQLQVGPARVGDVMCFEVAYDGVVRDTVDAGAQVIVVQTNNATYGHTGQPAQQLAMSRLRAVEHGRSVLVAATSGITAVVAPDGRVTRSLPQFTQGVIVTQVPLRTARTLADRLADGPEWALTILGLLAAGVAAVTRRGGRLREEPTTP